MNRYKFNSIVFEATPAVERGAAVAYSKDSDEPIYSGPAEAIPRDLDQSIAKLQMNATDVIALRAFVRTPQFFGMVPS